MEVKFGLQNCVSSGNQRQCDVVLGPWSRNNLGQPQSGAVGTALDHVMGESIFAQLPAGWWLVTSQIAVDFLAPVPAFTRLRAAADAAMVDAGGGYARGQLSDEQGNLLATYSAWLHHRPVSPAAVVPLEAPPATPPTCRPAANIDDYLGVDHGAGDGAVLITLSEPSRWTNFMGFVHGGVWTCLVEMAASRAVAQHNPALVPAGLHTIFLRPGRGDAAITVRADLQRVGSTSAVVDVLGRAADGAVCTRSTVTYRVRQRDVRI
ncbi:hypothetical protein A5712_15560 [Mycobacterium sp. E2327]|nr:hypothetical protein A5712_15560 [Mycobacterium sp. E2327]